MDKEKIISKIINYDFIIIFGCGKNGKTIYKYLKRVNVYKKVLCFADNNKYSIKSYKGKKVVRPLLAGKLRRSQKVLWIISSPLNSSQMCEQLYSMQIEATDILQLTSNDISFMYKLSHKYWYDEDRYFIYEYGFPINFNFMVKWWQSILYGCYYDFNIRKQNSLRIVEKKHRYNVSVCAIFLNEAIYMHEWIEFHKMVGVEHFYLYNNMSTDDYESVLEPYIKEGMVTLIDWNIPHGQISAYWDCLSRNAGESRWIGFIDLDEFVVTRKGRIYDFLKPYNYKCGAVLIYWKIFGGSEKDTRDLNGLVIEDFKRCWPKLLDRGKCFYNTEYSISSKEKNGLGLHHICWTRQNNEDYPPINIYGKVSLPSGIQRATKALVPVQINHYMIKSYMEYQDRMIRPDSIFENNPRSTSGFRYVDGRATGTDDLIDQYIPELKRRLEKRDEINE